MAAQTTAREYGTWDTFRCAGARRRAVTPYNYDGIADDAAARAAVITRFREDPDLVACQLWRGGKIIADLDGDACRARLGDAEGRADAAAYGARFVEVATILRNAGFAPAIAETYASARAVAAAIPPTPYSVAFNAALTALLAADAGEEG